MIGYASLRAPIQELVFPHVRLDLTVCHITCPPTFVASPTASRADRPLRRCREPGSSPSSSSAPRSDARHSVGQRHTRNDASSAVRGQHTWPAKGPSSRHDRAAVPYDLSMSAPLDQKPPEVVAGPSWIDLALSLGLPPVVCCLGTSPSHAEKSRPMSESSPSSGAKACSSHRSDWPDPRYRHDCAPPLRPGGRWCARSFSAIRVSSLVETSNLLIAEGRPCSRTCSGSLPSTDPRAPRP